jgi:hypothetical protein
VLFSSNVYLLLVLVLCVPVWVYFCCPVVSLFLELKVVVGVLVVQFLVQFDLELAPGQGGFEAVVLQCCFQNAGCAGNELAK